MAGLQIATVPESLPVKIADKAMRKLIVCFVVVAIIVLIVLDKVLIATVIRPTLAASFNHALKLGRGHRNAEEGME